MLSNGEEREMGRQKDESGSARPGQVSIEIEHGNTIETQTLTLKGKNHPIDQDGIGYSMTARPRDRK